MVSYGDIEDAARQTRDKVHRTPVVTSRLLDAECGNRMFLKCENLQRAGAFKARGAFNAISRLGEEQRRSGVVAYSSGNHAQAVALACGELGIPAVIVMPRTAPALKLAATRAYGAEVIQYDPATESREAIARQLAEEEGRTVIPPFDHPHIVAGQGTVALEFAEQTPDLEYLFVPCGGAGLLGGCAVAMRHLNPSCLVIGVEPEAGDDGLRSFRSGTLHSVHNPDTIADGARTSSLGTITFPLVRSTVADMVAVSDDDLIRAMMFVWTRLKLVVEPTGVLGLAAVLGRRYPLEGRRVGAVLSGGNVDLLSAADWFRRLA